ncbi:MAG: hypothetical protein QOH90_677, partial [Actinomycetota bacterium]|nr:hypothetical protein [Actinomycetota bacterium]
MAVGVLAAPALAATSQVNSTQDSPDTNPGDGFCRAVVDPTTCTLRAAIQEANAAAGADVIGVPAGDYHLTEEGAANDGDFVAGDTGVDLDVSGDTTFSCDAGKTDPPNCAVFADGQDRVFDVHGDDIQVAFENGSSNPDGWWWIAEGSASDGHDENGIDGGGINVRGDRASLDLTRTTLFGNVTGEEQTECEGGNGPDGDPETPDDPCYYQAGDGGAINMAGNGAELVLTDSAAFLNSSGGDISDRDGCGSTRDCFVAGGDGGAIAMNGDEQTLKMDAASEGDFFSQEAFGSGTNAQVNGSQLVLNRTSGTDTDDTSGNCGGDGCDVEYTGGDGGGVSTVGEASDVELDRSLLSFNFAGDAFFFGGSDVPDGLGGGIAVSGDHTEISGFKIHLGGISGDQDEDESGTFGNFAAAGGGLANTGTHVVVKLTSSDVLKNNAFGSFESSAFGGGGVYNGGNDFLLSLDDSSLGHASESDNGPDDGNHAGGFFLVSGSDFSASESYPFGAGGGVLNEGEGMSLALDSSEIAGNSSDGSGGGVFNSGDAFDAAMVDGSSIDQNFGYYGGGVYNSGRNATVLAKDSSIDSNDGSGFNQIGAGSGGGVYNDATNFDLALVRSSLDGNAGYYGAGFYNEG